MIRILFLLLITTISLHADDWKKYWIKAVEDCDKKDFSSAKQMFDLAVQCMEESNQDYSYVYIDRGRLNLLLENNEEALEDFNKALSNDKITKNDKSKASLSRMIVRTRLGIDTGVLEDLKQFAENHENAPTIENTNEHIIIRNAPDCPCYKNLMSCYFIHQGTCLSKNDIHILNSGIWVVKKRYSKNCLEANPKERICDVCGSVIRSVNNSEKIKTCKEWCDRIALSSAAWCGKAFKTYKCQTACGLAIYQIQRGCYWCCEGEGFYKRCVKPFEDVGKYIQVPCDPMWD